MAIMGRDPFGIIKEGEVHTISYKQVKGTIFGSSGKFVGW